ncbi:MAG: NAD(P)-dependent oxidoreductase [Caldimonas sp.]
MKVIDGIVITGAGGFLGRALGDDLSRLGIPFLALSRRALPGVRQVASYDDAPEAEIIVHLAEACDRASVNHMGDRYADDAYALVDALSNRTRRLVYASSSVVYGDSTEEPLSTDSPLVPTDTYARSKIRNEGRVRDTGGLVLRLANLYGSGMSTGNVLSDIARQIPGNGALRIRDAAPVRDFLSVAEAATAIVLAIRKDAEGVLNIGSGDGLSVGDVARLALKIFGEERRPIESSRPDTRRSINVLDVSATRDRIGWSPVPADVGLTHFFKSRGARIES